MDFSLAAPKGKASSTNGGDVWVLLITDTQPSDSDLYVCEVNTDPAIRSFHGLKGNCNWVCAIDVRKMLISIRILAVKSTNGTTKGTSSKSNSASTPETTTEVAEPETYVHDFTDCCRASNVSEKCLGFCTIHNILDGTAGIEPDACEADFPRIVRCMADGRNHQPCCQTKKIPDVCQVSLKHHNWIVRYSRIIQLSYDKLNWRIIDFNFDGNV